MARKQKGKHRKASKGRRAQKPGPAIEPAEYASVKPDKPFGMAISQLGSQQMVPTTCLGAGLGFVAADGPVFADDGRSLLTGQQLRDGVFGMLYLDGGGQAPLQLCLRPEDVEGLKALLVQLEDVLATVRDDAEESARTAQPMHRPGEGAPDGVQVH